MNPRLLAGALVLHLMAAWFRRKDARDLERQEREAAL